MFCGKCGANLEETAAFCHVCGAPVNSTERRNYTVPAQNADLTATAQRHKKEKNCRVCGESIPAKAKSCPNCGAKNKKPLLKRWWFWVLLVIVLVIAFPSGDDDVVEQDNVVASSAYETEGASLKETAGSENKAVAADEPVEPAKTVYCVGDILQDGDMTIAFVSSGEYVEESEYSQPEEGYKYIFLEFALENTSDEDDHGISFYDFTCYADGYAAEMYYSASENLSATLSAGRGTTGCVYFIIPEDAIDIEVEYETNFFTEEKITFIYEGEQESGYELSLNASATEGAYAVGEIAESSNLKITYISCEESESDNMFIEPRNGYCFMTCEFEFENVGTSDEYVSSYDFDCYADGFNCEQSFFMDNDLSAELSAGRKTTGSVTFEVPVDAEIIELEYLSNYWTSNRVVFTMK